MHTVRRLLRGDGRPQAQHGHHADGAAGGHDCERDGVAGRPHLPLNRRINLSATFKAHRPRSTGLRPSEGSKYLRSDRMPEYNPEREDMSVRPATARPAGRPRNPELDRAILAAAEQQLREAGYAGMSVESVAAAAGTTVPAVRRRFSSKAGMAVAVIDSLRVESLPATSGPPRSRALTVLRNLHTNLLRSNSMAMVGTLLAEEHRHPELLAAFRSRLVEGRRTALRQVVAEGISCGELPGTADPDVLASMLIGSFYARYIATSDIPDDWAEQTLWHLWPDASSAQAHR
jgi:AcrR family transcriptional regulator